MRNSPTLTDLVIFWGAEQNKSSKSKKNKASPRKIYKDNQQTQEQEGIAIHEALGEGDLCHDLEVFESFDCQSLAGC